MAPYQIDSSTILVLIQRQGEYYEIHRIVLFEEETDKSIILRIQSLLVEEPITSNTLTKKLMHTFMMRKLGFGTARILEASEPRENMLDHSLTLWI